MNQKAFAPILIVLGIMLIAGIVTGAYYLGTKRITNLPSVVKSTPKSTNTLNLRTPLPSHSFQDTTKGLEISLQDKLAACEYATSDVKLGEVASCDDLRDTRGVISIDTYNQFHQPVLGTVTQKTRQESLRDWVVRIANADKNNMPKLVQDITTERSDNISNIDSITVLDDGTYKYTDSKGIVSYNYKSTIYQENGNNIIVLDSEISNTKARDIDELKNLLPLIHTTPITTGDLGLNVTWHHNRNSGVYVGYTGYLYQTDQKTIAANIKTDSKGQYFVRLKPGIYYFIYPDGSSKQIQVQLGRGVVPLPNIDIATEKDMFNGPVPNAPPSLNERKRF